MTSVIVGVNEKMLKLMPWRNGKSTFLKLLIHLLHPKPKSSFHNLKRGIQDFHMNFVLVPADKVAVVV